MIILTEARKNPSLQEDKVSEMDLSPAEVMRVLNQGNGKPVTYYMGFSPNSHVGNLFDTSLPKLWVKPTSFSIGGDFTNFRIDMKDIKKGDSFVDNSGALTKVTLRMHGNIGLVIHFK